MSASEQLTYFGKIYPPDEAWLAKQPPEPIRDPDLPIIDPHHHLWDRPNHRYLLDDFLADVRTGHNIVATVFEECHSMYRASGPEELRSVGETEFVAGIAAMSASGLYGPTRVAAGIVGFADLTLGDRVEPVLEALIRAGGGRFRGVRHSAGWDASEAIGNSRTATGPHVLRQPDFRAGLARLTTLGLSFDAWVYHPQLDDVIDLARAFPTTPIIMCHVGGPLGFEGSEVMGKTGDGGVGAIGELNVANLSKAKVFVQANRYKLGTKVSATRCGSCDRRFPSAGRARSSPQRSFKARRRMLRLSRASRASVSSMAGNW
jgi:predicted TIM-barrel fold metal-dependent hydrolase